MNLKLVLLPLALLSRSVLYMQHAESVHVCFRGKAKGALPQDSVQALDVALKNGASNHPDCVTLPRAFFFYDPEVVKPVGGGAEVCLLHPCSLDLSPCSTNVALGSLSVIIPSNTCWCIAADCCSGDCQEWHCSCTSYPQICPWHCWFVVQDQYCIWQQPLLNWASSLYIQSWA